MAKSGSIFKKELRKELNKIENAIKNIETKGVRVNIVELSNIPTKNITQEDVDTYRKIRKTVEQVEYNLKFNIPKPTATKPLSNRKGTTVSYVDTNVKGSTTGGTKGAKASSTTVNPKKEKEKSKTKDKEVTKEKRKLSQEQKEKLKQGNEKYQDCLHKIMDTEGVSYTEARKKYKEMKEKGENPYEKYNITEPKSDETLDGFSGETDEEEFDNSLDNSKEDLDNSVENYKSLPEPTTHSYYDQDLQGRVEINAKDFDWVINFKTDLINEAIDASYDDEVFYRYKLEIDEIVNKIDYTIDDVVDAMGLSEARQYFDDHTALIHTYLGGMQFASTDAQYEGAYDTFFTELSGGKSSPLTAMPFQPTLEDLAKQQSK